MRKQAGKRQRRKIKDNDSECAASLIRPVSLCESSSAVLCHVPLIINMHCGATWQKAIAKAISFPKQGLWGVHFKCPLTTTQSELHLEEENVIEKKKKKKNQDLPPVKRQKQHGNTENIKCHEYMIPPRCVVNLCKPRLNLSLRWRRSSCLWHWSWGLEQGPHNIRSTCCIFTKQTCLSHVYWMLLLIWTRICNEIMFVVLLLKSSWERFFCYKPGN